jgi:hypothetical protein
MFVHKFAEKKIVAPVKKINFDATTRLYSTFFLSFLYIRHKFFCLHQKFCTNIKSHDVHHKFYVYFFNIFKFI